MTGLPFSRSIFRRPPSATIGEAVSRDLETFDVDWVDRQDREP